MRRKVNFIFLAACGAIVSYFCLGCACLCRLKGVGFDLFGRKLFFRGLLRKLPKASLATLGLNPVGASRFFEFHFAGRALKEMRAGRWLDVSSPRLIFLWGAEKLNFQVNVINPDPLDLKESIALSKIVRNGRRINFYPNTFAGSLPFKDSSIDILTSLSVLEHIPGEGDKLAMDEFIRVVRPQGRIVLTLPVHGQYSEEYRENDPYAIQAPQDGQEKKFFQRLYDEQSLEQRIIAHPGLTLLHKEYFVERRPGDFEHYLREWKSQGLNFTLKDPLAALRIFKGPLPRHPKDRFGNCNLLLLVVK